MASKIVPGDTQVLAGIEDRLIEDWPWGLGGDYRATPETKNRYQRQTRYPVLLEPVKVRTNVI
ncbi:MAG: hypothetical protein HC890_16370 [Chloroflexaceae bacterium]|nr:hypothetical protein [Chloroflexaceae bacterium]